MTKKEYTVANNRRFDLIHKKHIGGGLTEEETVELADLQEKTLAYIDKLYPRPDPTPMLKQLQELEEKLKKAGK